MPDESKVVFDERVRRVDGQILAILSHLSFTLMVVGRGEDGRGCIEGMLSSCARILRYVCDDAPTPWEGDVIGPLASLGGLATSHLAYSLPRG